MKLPKIYEPNQYQQDIYDLWESSGAFVPKNRGSNDYFSLVVPPPNANASMHIGTGMTLAIEDTLARYHRLKGDATLFVPGADHAGFETQTVYEKQLAKEGKSRFDFTREELYRDIWKFVDGNRERFETQFRGLGASVDWQHFTFTLDEKVVKLAYATFKRMWDDGLIYRGERLVNFCTFHGTAFADIEVEYKESKGKLWYIRYPFTDGNGEVVVATTRPETMLGDTAVAVNPKDSRYKQIIGKTIKLPLTNREIPIIADPFVDPKFGTGAVKITPAHDPNDFEIAKRHDLPMITVIDHEGKMTHSTPVDYRGLESKEARNKIVSDLEEQGLLAKTVDHTHSVGHCYKCGSVIEPLLREQWFIDMQPLAKRAIEELKAGKITFYPESKKEQLIQYLEELRDWNISRQIAWGIPIPAFVNIDDPDDWIFDERVDQQIIEIDNKTYHRDLDVFDTWFSSSSWPYATLDFPDGDSFKKYYPLSIMETGGEILYPWVSRMIMLGLYVTDQVPFKEVYIHGYVLAEDGSKMSKSVGNTVDLSEAIEKYGSDAFRMGIMASRTAGVNRGYDPRKLQDARNFCNKLWNVARFIEDKLGDNYNGSGSFQIQNSADAWILNRLYQTIEGVSSTLDDLRFSEAYDLIYHFLWDDVADWYIEVSKIHLNPQLIVFVLESCLKLAHPFAPFVTETIWQTLKTQADTLLATSHWPSVDKPKRSAQEFDEIINIVSEIRYIVGVLGLQDMTLFYKESEFLDNNALLIQKLSKISGLRKVIDGQGLTLTNTKHLCWLGVDKESIKKFLKELEPKKAQQQQVVQQLEKRLSNKQYTQKAPKKLVDQSTAQLATANELLKKIDDEYQRFGSII